MTKFHFYVLMSLICFMGIFNCPAQLRFWLLLGTILFWTLALWWAWVNRPNDVK